MKNMILCLLVMLFCITACKKTEETTRVRFAQTEFVSATKYAQIPYVLYRNVKYSGGGIVTSEYGDRNFELFKSNGEKITDFKMTIAGSQKYYIYQPDSTTVPVLLTELPLPPPPPAGPLDDATAAKDGYMKVKMFNDSQDITGIGKVDVQVLSTINSASAYDLVTTIPDIDATAGKDFVEFQRPMRAGVPQNNFKFRFLRSDTKQPINSVAGGIFTTVSPLSITARTLSVYLITIEYLSTTNTTGIEKAGEYYNLKCRIIEAK